MTDGSRGRRVGDRWDLGQRRVLIALASPEAAGRLGSCFEALGVLPTLVFSCDHLVRQAREEAYGLIVLDARLACLHDSRCLGIVRGRSTTPIIGVGSFDSGSGNGMEIVLDSRADAVEVARRGTALIDMSRPVRLSSSIRWGPLELDVERHEARWHGRAIRLTALQFRIMEVLALAGGSVVSVGKLSRRVWGEGSVEDRDRLVQHVRRIRKLIEEDPSRPRFLLRGGGGFRLSEGEEANGPEEGSNRQRIEL